MLYGRWPNIVCIYCRTWNVCMHEMSANFANAADSRTFRAHEYSLCDKVMKMGVKPLKSTIQKFAKFSRTRIAKVPNSRNFHVANILCSTVGIPWLSRSLHTQEPVNPGLKLFKSISDSLICSPHDMQELVTFYCT